VSVDESGIYAAGVTGEALVEGGCQGDFDVILRK
jgi:hypothetical protein